jgi:hypothetical protein
MKKILLLSFVVLFISCSKSEIDTNQILSSKRVISNFELELIAFFNSSEYIEHINRINDFVDKSNFDGDINDLSSFNELILWVENNLSRTDFVDLSEVNGLSYEILSSTLYVDNIELFDNIYRNQFLFKDLSLLHDPQFQFQVFPSSNCEEQFTVCTSSAANAYASSVIVAVGLAISGTATSEQIQDMMNIATIVLRISIGICTEDYINCLN